MNASKISFLVLAIALFSIGYAQTFDWAQSIGSANDIISIAIANDDESNAYIVGTFQGVVDFDPDTTNQYLLHSKSFSKDVYIKKIDSLGNLLWVKSIEGNYDDDVSDIKIDKEGYIYISGIFQGIADFAPGTQVANHSAGITHPDMFLLKLDEDGEFVWVKTFGGLGYDKLESIAIDSENNIYSIGRFRQTVDFNPSSAVENRASLGSDDIFIQKMSKNGVFKWVKTIGGVGSDIGRTIAIDKNDDIVFGAQIESYLDINPNNGNTLMVNVEGNYDGLVEKLDKHGNFVWAKTIKSFRNLGYCLLRSIDIDKDDNIIGTGIFNDSIDFDPSSNTYVPLNYRYNAFVFKFNLNGDFNWVRTFGNSTNATIPYDQGLKTITDTAGNIYTAGYFTRQVEFASEPQNQTSYSYVNGGTNRSGFVQKLDADGNFKQIISIISAERDFINSLSIDNKSNMYIAGVFTQSATIKIDSTIVKTDMTGISPSGTVFNMFVMKLSNITNYVASNNNNNNNPNPSSPNSIENLGFEQVNLYPNPTKDKFTIEVSEDLTSLHLFDLSGKKIKSYNPQAKQFEVSSIAKGVYFLELKSTEKIAVIKVIVQ